jgi:hypothetical protein
MNKEYKATVIVLGVASALLVGAAIITTSGLGASVSEEPNNITVVDSTSDSFDVKLIENSSEFENGTSVWVREGENRSTNEYEVDGKTVVLNADERDEMFEGTEKKTYAKNVYDAVKSEAEYKNFASIEIQVDQIYESGDHDTPTDEAIVHVRPANQRVPEVTAITSLSADSVNVTSTVPRVTDVDITIKEGLGVLNDSDVDTLEQLATEGHDLSYYIAQEFEDPSEISATVIEATNDGTVDLHLSQTESDSQVGVTVDLDDDEVESTWMIVSLEDSDLTISEANSTETVEFEDSG